MTASEPTAAAGGPPPPDRLDTALRVATLIWVVGMATVFPLGNDALEAVSIFTFDRIAFLVVAALLAIAVVRRPALLRDWDRVEVVMAVYLAVVAASWVATLPAKDAVDVKRDLNLLLCSFIMPFTAFVVARHARWTPRQVAAACMLVVVGIGAYLVVVGVIQGLVDWRFLVAEADQDFHASRARGPFPNAVPYAVLIGVLVPVALVLRAQQPRRWQRALMLVVCIGLLEALILSRVRVVWVALPAALLYFAAIHRPVRRAAVVAGLGLLVAVTLASVGVDLSVMSRPDGAGLQPRGSVGERLAEAGPIYNRVAVYATALNMIVHRPLVGFGFGAHTFETARAPYYTSCCGVAWEWAVKCAVPHNEVLNLLVLMGVVGLVVYLGLVAVVWRLLSFARTSAAGRGALALAAALQAAAVVLVISAQLHDMMYLSVVQVIFFFLVGLAARGTQAVASATPPSVQ